MTSQLFPMIDMQGEIPGADPNNYVSSLLTSCLNIFVVFDIWRS